MFLGKKLSVVDAIKSVPIDVSKAIRRVNDVRNDIAHTFFPENRRRYIADKHVTYRGSPLFSIEGLEKFRRRKGPQSNTVAIVQMDCKVRRRPEF